MNQHSLFPSDGNVTYLRPPKAETTTGWPWMRRYAGWWDRTTPTLDWQPISLYRPYHDEGMSIASPVLLRQGKRWAYGSRVGSKWRRFTEGASWPLDDFEPTEWADVDLDDGIMLGQE